MQAPAAGFPNTAPRTGHRACRDLGFSLTLGPGGGGGELVPKERQGHTKMEMAGERSPDHGRQPGTESYLMSR